MANRRLFALVQQGAIVWNAWREENTSINYIDMSEVKFFNVNRSGAKLSGVNL
jgi:hypothetical protein